MNVKCINDIARSVQSLSWDSPSNQEGVSERASFYRSIFTFLSTFLPAARFFLSSFLLCTFLSSFLLCTCLYLFLLAIFLSLLQRFIYSVKISKPCISSVQETALSGILYEFFDVFILAKNKVSGVGNKQSPYSNSLINTLVARP